MATLPSSSDLSILSVKSLLNSIITVRSLPLSRIFTGLLHCYDYTGCIFLSEVTEIRVIPFPGTVVSLPGTIAQQCKIERTLPMVAIERQYVTSVFVEHGDFDVIVKREKQMNVDAMVGGVD